MRTQPFSILIAVVLLSSCYSSKRTGLAYIPGGQTVYYVTVDSTDRARKKLVSTPYTTPQEGVLGKVEFDEDNGQLKLEIHHPLAATGLAASGQGQTQVDRTGADVTCDEVACTIKAAKEKDAARITQFKYPVFQADTPPDSTACKTARPKPNQVVFYRGKPFRFREFQGFMQAITVPVKIRFALSDSVRSTTESGFNAGYALGYRRTHHGFRNLYDCPHSMYLKSKRTSWSVAWGGFAGPLVQALNAANTDGKVKKERSYLGLTAGVFGAYAKDEFSLGLAGGMDLPLGDGADQWNYFGKPWIGIILGLGIDIFK